MARKDKDALKACRTVHESPWEEGVVIRQRILGPCSAHRGPWTYKCKMGFAKVRADAPARAAVPGNVQAEALGIPSSPLIKELPHQKSVKGQCRH